jgi:aryl-phospho-beta-D-glucosidase BglC (GH1 family)
MTQRRGHPGWWIAFLALVLLMFMQSAAAIAATAVATHGALSVRGNRIVNKNGEPVSLAGPSLFWSNNGWGGERFYNAKAVAAVQQDWNATVIRAAMGVEAPGGYVSDPQGNMDKVVLVVDAAIASGMYVIIDWHSHLAQEHERAATRFFETMAKRYGETPNVIYEIYNEPLDDADWSTTVKPYAQRVIAAIRAIDPDNLIAVGTQTWSQDVDQAAADPIRDQTNVAYTLHFYAGSHGRSLREKAQKALDAGAALFVTEWGSVSARGDGRVIEKETLRWMDFLRTNQLSHCNWALNDKQEAASALVPGSPADGPWPESTLTASGKLARRIIKSWHTVDYDGAQ